MKKYKRTFRGKHLETTFSMTIRKPTKKETVLLVVLGILLLSFLWWWLS